MALQSEQALQQPVSAAATGVQHGCSAGCVEYPSLLKQSCQHHMGDCRHGAAAAANADHLLACALHACAELELLVMSCSPVLLSCTGSY
jgi:hypothetical protein